MCASLRQEATFGPTAQEIHPPNIFRPRCRSRSLLELTYVSGVILIKHFRNLSTFMWLRLDLDNCSIVRSQHRTDMAALNLCAGSMQGPSLMSRKKTDRTTDALMWNRTETHQFKTPSPCRGEEADVDAQHDTATLHDRERGDEPRTEDRPQTPTHNMTDETTENQTKTRCPGLSSRTIVTF